MEPNDSQHQGADLIFLSEFPIGVLADRPPEVKSVQFELKETGKRKPKRWMIDAGESFGLPNYVDMQIFIICLAYTKEQGFPDQVHFCRHRLIRDLGWSRGQENYDRVQLGLDRMVATTYRAINHYPDPKGRECVQRMAFHLMEAYEIHDSRAADAELPPSWFRWSEEVRRLLNTRQLKTLDLEVFRTLKRPVSQAMYRYLHTRRMDGKATFEENLVEYACERLGLSRDFRWASDLKRTLNEGHRELVQKGLIASATYERMRAEKGARPQQKVVIQYPTPEPLPAALTEPVTAAAADPAVDPLLQQLLDHGITAGIAADLVAAHRDECERQLAYLLHRDGLQNPAGALRRAIEEAWPAPDSWQHAQKKRRRTPAPRVSGPNRPSPTPDTLLPTPDTDPAAFDTWWAALPAARRAAIDQAAAAALPDPASVAGQHLARHPAARERLLRELRLQYKEVTSNE